MQKLMQGSALRLDPMLLNIDSYKKKRTIFKCQHVLDACAARHCAVALCKRMLC